MEILRGVRPLYPRRWVLRPDPRKALARIEPHLKQLQIVVEVLPVILEQLFDVKDPLIVVCSPLGAYTGTFIVRHAERHSDVRQMVDVDHPGLTFKTIRPPPPHQHEELL